LCAIGFDWHSDFDCALDGLCFEFLTVIARLGLSWDIQVLIALIHTCSFENGTVSVAMVTLLHEFYHFFLYCECERVTGRLHFIGIEFISGF
jgi:hypothetical protein